MINRRDGQTSHQVGQWLALGDEASGGRGGRRLISGRRWGIPLAILAPLLSTSMWSLALADVIPPPEMGLRGITGVCVTVGVDKADGLSENALKLGVEHQLRVAGIQVVEPPCRQPTEADLFLTVWKVNVDSHGRSVYSVELFLSQQLQLVRDPAVRPSVAYTFLRVRRGTTSAHDFAKVVREQSEVLAAEFAKLFIELNRSKLGEEGEPVRRK